jgi:hypothetical protein
VSRDAVTAVERCSHTTISLRSCMTSLRRFPAEYGGFPRENYTDSAFRAPAHETGARAGAESGWRVASAGNQPARGGVPGDANPASRDA